jgi:hypothetical protein
MDLGTFFIQQYLSPAFFLKASIVASVAPVLVAVFATSRFIRTLMRDDSARRRPH